MSTKELSDFEWAWIDRAHLDAHIHDFIQDPDAILAQLYTEVCAAQPAQSALEEAERSGSPCWFQRDFELAEPAGFSGLRNVCEKDENSFWGYRIGRGIPSHLCLGEKEQTRWVCLWGQWAPGRFLIHTLYPGRVAPREIHDPALELDQIGPSLEFWRCHAIIVGETEYSTRPGT